MCIYLTCCAKWRMWCVRSSTPSEHRSIWWTKKPKSWSPVAIIGNVARSIRVPISPKSLAGYCATSKKPFLIRDAYEDLSVIDSQLQFDRRWDDVNQFRTRDVMCAPSLFKNELMGVVQVINSRASGFTEADLHLLQTISRPDRVCAVSHAALPRLGHHEEGGTR